MGQLLLGPVTFRLNDRLTVFPHPDASPVITAIVSLSLVYMCEAGPLICEELFLGFPTGTLVCVYCSVRMPLFHKSDMPFCYHGKPFLKIYIAAFGLDVFLSQWFRACYPQGQI